MNKLLTYKMFLENLSMDSIMKDTRTTPQEKEELTIKLNIKQHSEYQTKKRVFDNMFGDVEQEIDIPTLNRLIGENPFLKEYSQLLYKKRDILLMEKTIESNEISIEELEEEIKKLERSKNDTPEELSNDNSPSVSDQISANRNKISELRANISNLNNKIRQQSIDAMLRKWDDQMSVVIRDLRKGKSLLMSTLSNLR